MSTVRETIHKFRMRGTSNKLSSSPPPPSLPITVNNNHINESPTLSVISSTHSEPMMHSNPTEQNGTQSNRKSSTRVDIRPPRQQKPSRFRRRTPPPIPLESRSSN